MCVDYTHNILFLEVLKMKKNNKKGFTLVELVIVVAVMAVLVAVAIPTVGSITGSAKTAVNNSNAQTIESMLKLAEAEGTKTSTDGSSSVDPAKIAQVIVDAKLGIENGTYLYNTKTGNVTYGDGEASGNVCKIAFTAATTGTNAKPAYVTVSFYKTVNNQVATTATSAALYLDGSGAVPAATPPVDG
jgi:type IV pilus assembly protein PilA